MRQTIIIPLQPLVTATETQHGHAIELSAEVWQAIDAWHAIKDEQEATLSASVLQERINDLCHPTD